MVYSYTQFGYKGHVVKVEIDISRGLPGMEIIGLASSEIQEAKERVKISLRSTGFQLPKSKIVVSLSPSGIKKSGVAFDLALAVAILVRDGQVSLPEECTDLLVLGELELSGKINAVSGVIAAVDEARKLGISHILLSPENKWEAHSIDNTKIGVVSSLSDIRELKNLFDSTCPSTEENSPSKETSVYKPDFSDYRGNVKLVRASLIAAVGRHNILYYGPPGYGKSMAAQRLPSLLPPLSIDESIEVTRVFSLAQRIRDNLERVTLAPIRSPHHSSTLEGIIGGGKTLVPGDVSLAHRGILFLDEVTEFRARVLQALREPIEQHELYLSRAGRMYWFPADFQLVMCSNLCPCGNFGHQKRECLCSKTEIFRYWRKFGSALLDRIDIRFFTNEVLSDEDRACDMQELRNCADRALHIQKKRARDVNLVWNSRMSEEKIRVACNMNKQVERLFLELMKKNEISRRGQVSILKIARSIADVDGIDCVIDEHIIEAVEYRQAPELRGILGV